ncbi:MAG: type II secretion system protein GspN [bacterium]|nr:type II secretion system protein GspN [bacterium]
MLKKFKKILFYVSLFFLGVFAGIYFFFPSDLVKKLINVNQDIVRIDKIDLIFPFGLYFSGVDLKITDNKTAKFSYVQLSPSLLLPFTFPFGKADLKISAVSPGTDLKTWLSLIKKEQNFNIDSINIKGKIELYEIPLDKFRGKGEVFLNIDLDQISEIEKSFGKIEIFSNKLTFEISGWQLFEGEITLGETEFIGNIESGVLRIIKFQSKGGDIEGTITGKINLKKELMNSELDLVLDVKTKIINLPAQKFKLQGRISQPSISSL